MINQQCWFNISYLTDDHYIINFSIRSYQIEQITGEQTDLLHRLPAGSAFWQIAGGEIFRPDYWWAECSVRLLADRSFNHITGGQIVQSYYWRADHSIILLTGRPFNHITNGQTVLFDYWRPDRSVSMRASRTKILAWTIPANSY